MIAVNASKSPHSSESLTPFGSKALILEEPQGPAVRPGDAGWLSHRATSTSSERVSSGRPQSAAMTGINVDRDDTVGNPDSLASLTHLRRTFALTPWASARPDIETPGSRQAATSRAFDDGS